jgi:uncharacterized protein (DUF2252 family)
VPITKSTIRKLVNNVAITYVRGKFVNSAFSYIKTSNANGIATELIGIAHNHARNHALGFEFLLNSKGNLILTSAKASTWKIVYAMNVDFTIGNEINSASVTLE